MNDAEILIRPARLEDIAGLHSRFDAVARERRYLACLETPPLEQSRAYWSGMIENGCPFEAAFDGPRAVGTRSRPMAGRSAWPFTPTIAAAASAAGRSRRRSKTLGARGSSASSSAFSPTVSGRDDSMKRSASRRKGCCAVTAR